MPKKEKLEIQKCLVLSTAHIDYKAISPNSFHGDILDCGEDVRVSVHEYGWFCFLYHEMSSYETKGGKFPNVAKWFVPILKYCLKNKIYMVNFDQDGTTYDMFKNYESTWG
jgi:hypothetical protein